MTVELIDGRIVAEFEPIVEFVDLNGKVVQKPEVAKFGMYTEEGDEKVQLIVDKWIGSGRYGYRPVNFDDVIEDLEALSRTVSIQICAGKAGERSYRWEEAKDTAVREAVWWYLQGYLPIGQWR
jgi:hypothetical protein